MERRISIAMVVAVLCVAAAGVFGYRQSKALDENHALQERIVTLEQDNSDLKNRLKQLTTADDSLKGELDALKAENEDLKLKPGKGTKPARER